MSSTWFIGDIHGCAEELAELLDLLSPSAEDRIIALGDLYHRGPDPLGVADVFLDNPRLELVFGNHELALMRRAGMAPRSIDGEVRPLPDGAGGYEAEELSGDGGTPMRNIDPERSIRLLRVLERGRFYFRGQAGPGPVEGAPWLAVHAGIPPKMKAEQCAPDDLCRLRRLGRRRNSPFWYNKYRGEEGMVLFGHTHSQLPRRHMHRGQLVAHGLDTGCVYGNCLTAWRIEDDAYEVVQAKRKHYP